MPPKAAAKGKAAAAKAKAPAKNAKAAVRAPAKPKQAAAKAVATAPAKKKAPVNKKPAAKANTKKMMVNGDSDASVSKKRKADDSAEAPDAQNDAAPQAKRVKAEPRSRVKAIPDETGPKINQVPKDVLDIYVFGEGTSGELGLGSKKVDGKKPIDVKRPRLNKNLAGVVQIACGGMHVAAITRDNKVLTWGVNDQGALGRDTNWDGGLRDMDGGDDSDDDEDDVGLNPRESLPGEVPSEFFAPNAKFTQIVASDSASFVLTETGRVYGWGTFRSSDGILGFTETIHVQNRPMLMPNLKNITKLAAGSNHILALDNKGNVVAWGCGQQNQLGRRIIERNKMSSLVPQGMGLPKGKIVKIACGAYHSFAIDNKGKVWGWGLNNFGELGDPSNAGSDDAVVLKPVKIDLLDDHNITDIDGGNHHSLACSDKGQLFTWGRIDGFQVGFQPDELKKEDVIFDERETPRILATPTVNPAVKEVVAVTAGSDNSFAVTSKGEAYSWGFSTNYQTGQGTIEDVEEPTLIDNTAVRGKHIVGAGAGGQYSILYGKAEDAPKTNGVH